MKNQTVINYDEHKQKLKKLHITYVFVALAIIGILATAYSFHYVWQMTYEQELKAISKTGQTLIKLGKTKQAMAMTQAPEEMSMKEWIRWRITSEGIDWNKFDCMVKHESNYNQYAINKNTNGTFDIGYLQINEIHKLPRETAFDYKQATEWAIKKINKDGNMMAWYGFRNHCQ